MFLKSKSYNKMNYSKTCSRESLFKKHVKIGLQGPLASSTRIHVILKRKKTVMMKENLSIFSRQS
jgi:hypothetical protein